MNRLLLSRDALMAREDAGATITRPEPPPAKPMVIDGFAELLEKMDEMIQVNVANAQAALAQATVQREVLMTMQKLIPTIGRQKVNMAPITTVLSQIQDSQALPRDRTAWDFDVTKDRAGMHIHAEPVMPTIN